MPRTPPKTDDAYLLDMVEAARVVQQLVAELGGDKAAFMDNLAHQLAIRYEIQIVGEAAFKLSQKIKAQINLPWPDVENMRHRLVHDYGNIDLDIMWDTATKNMQEVIDTLEPLLPPDEED